MLETSYLVNNIQYNNIILVTKGSDDPVLWYFFLLFFIIIGIISVVLIFLYSKIPEEWEHNPTIDKYYEPGKLRYLANSVKLMPVDYSDTSSMKEYIQILFFEKIRALYGIPARELMSLKRKNPEKLHEIIKDKEIVDFILNFENKEEKRKFGDGFKQNRSDRRKKYFKDINLILDKMEAWGE